MSSSNTLDPELLAELVSDIDSLGIEVLYLRAAKVSISKAVAERNVSLDVICASVNQRLKKLGRAVESTHIRAILEESQIDSDELAGVFQRSFRGRARPTRAPRVSPDDSR